jgi:hydroxyethylthiazole kinase-like uncharacterized protein yjeF
VKVVSPEQMREIDRRAIEDLGISGALLMERAGEAVARAVLSLPESLPVHCFCGSGNNGGDGFVAARYLHQWGRDVTVWLLARASSLAGDARASYDKAKGAAVPIHELPDADPLERHLGGARGGFIAIDALLGTGARGNPRGRYAEAVKVMNSAASNTVAVDCPTGLDAETGSVGDPCVMATITVTMGLPKTGLVLWPGLARVGELVVADIGFPKELLEDPEYRLNALSQEDASRALPDRPRDAHKGTCGKLLVIAGSQGYTGAAALTAMAALRAGTGLVYVGVPKGLNDILEVKLTEAITVPLPETDERTLSFDALAPILEWMGRVDALALGPGLSQHPDTVRLVRTLVPRVALPCVLDADGLNALAPVGDDFTVGTHFVLTPHPGEMARLTDGTVPAIQSDRVTSCRQLAARLGCTVLLKGVPTVVGGPLGDVFINRTGNPGMATGGTGDVLTGLIGALLAQGLPPLKAGALGAYLHGQAGDRAAVRLGQAGMIAGDLLDDLPAVLLATHAIGTGGSSKEHGPAT